MAGGDPVQKLVEGDGCGSGADDEALHPRRRLVCALPGNPVLYLPWVARRLDIHGHGRVLAAAFHCAAVDCAVGVIGLNPPVHAHRHAAPAGQTHSGIRARAAAHQAVDADRRWPRIVDEDRPPRRAGEHRAHPPDGEDAAARKMHRGVASARHPAVHRDELVADPLPAGGAAIGHRAAGIGDVNPRHAARHRGPGGDSDVDAPVAVVRRAVIGAESVAPRVDGAAIHRDADVSDVVLLQERPHIALPGTVIPGDAGEAGQARENERSSRRHSREDLLFALRKSIPEEIPQKSSAVVAVRPQPVEYLLVVVAPVAIGVDAARAGDRYEIRGGDQLAELIHDRRLARFDPRRARYFGRRPHAGQQRGLGRRAHECVRVVAPRYGGHQVGDTHDLGLDSRRPPVARRLLDRRPPVGHDHRRVDRGGGEAARVGLLGLPCLARESSRPGDVDGGLGRRRARLVRRAAARDVGEKAPARRDRPPLGGDDPRGRRRRRGGAERDTETRAILRRDRRAFGNGHPDVAAPEAVNMNAVGSAPRRRDRDAARDAHREDEVPGVRGDGGYIDSVTRGGIRDRGRRPAEELEREGVREARIGDAARIRLIHASGGGLAARHRPAFVHSPRVLRREKQGGEERRSQRSGDSSDAAHLRSPPCPSRRNTLYGLPFRKSKECCPVAAAARDG